jgi:hypothetical protein
MNSDALWGWAQNSDDPENPVCLHIFADGCVIGRVLANGFRAALKQAGLGSGRYTFHFVAPKGVDLTKVWVEARRSFDGAALGGPARQAA